LDPAGPGNPEHPGPAGASQEAGIVGRRVTAGSVVEFGVQTLSGKTVLTVTHDRVEAEHILGLLGEGRLVQRTVNHRPWVLIPAETAVAD
jgi:hypothetical protein